MGEYAEMILDGVMCQFCGEWIPECCDGDHSDENKIIVPPELDAVDWKDSLRVKGEG